MPPITGSLHMQAGGFLFRGSRSFSKDSKWPIPVRQKRRSAPPPVVPSSISRAAVASRLPFVLSRKRLQKATDRRPRLPWRPPSRSSCVRPTKTSCIRTPHREKFPALPAALRVLAPDRATQRPGLFNRRCGACFCQPTDLFGSIITLGNQRLADVSADPRASAPLSGSERRSLLLLFPPLLHKSRIHDSMDSLNRVKDLSFNVHIGCKIVPGPARPCTEDSPETLFTLPTTL